MYPDPTSLWLLPEQAVDGFAAELGGTRLLTAHERAQLDLRLTTGARRRYLGARLLCRHALSVRTGHPMDRWRFRLGVHGRPEPEPDVEGVRFNLSHTEGLIACVVTQGRACGVDVAPTPSTTELAAHLERRLAPAERTELAAAPAETRTTLASELWVLKEAYLKALGTGLRRSLDGFSFAPRGADRIVVHDPQAPAGADTRWWFDLLHPGPGFVLAVATEDGRPGALHRTDLSDFSLSDLSYV